MNEVILVKTNDRSSTNSNSDSTRAAGDDLVKDRYVEFLEQQNSSLVFHVNQINLLEFQLINKDQLRSKLIDILMRESKSYTAMILTSRQTVEAFQSATFENDNELNDSFKKYMIECVNDDDNDRDDGSNNKLTVYCVGDQTAKAFRAYTDRLRECGALRKVDRLVIKSTSSASSSSSDDRRQHKQNSAELAKLIVNDFNSNGSSSSPKNEALIFYPCSSIRKDDLSSQLKENGIQFDELFVYNTGQSSEGIRRFKQSIDEASKLENRICVVFFSPSGVESAFEAAELKSNAELNKFHFVSVGPSTSIKLKQYPISFDEMSEPSPKALFDSLTKLLSSSSSSASNI